MLLLPMVRFSAIALFWVLLRFSVEAQVRSEVLESIAKDQEEAIISGNDPNGVMVMIVFDLPQGGVDVAGDSCPMKTQIKTMQNEVIGAMKHGFKSVYEYSCVPCIAGLVYSMDVIEALEINGNVLQVDLDVMATLSGLQAERKVLVDSVPFVKAPLRHQQGNKGKGIVVAVIDSGIDAGHPNFEGRIKAEASFIGGTQVGPGVAEDQIGHGTHVTGIIASSGAVGGVGMAPEADIVCVKVLGGLSGSVTDLIAGIDYIVNNIDDLKVKIVNISLGFGSFPGICDAQTSLTMMLAKLTNQLRLKGVSIFTAAGNVGSDSEMPAPACISDCVAVGAMRLDGDPAGFSNSNMQTDIFAPGAKIISSAIGGGSVAQSGTSVASPHAAGCAALLVESGEATTPEDIENRLETSDSTVYVPSNNLIFPVLDCSPLPPIVTRSPLPAIVTGDPHFRTWHGKTFSYHGECDLVLISSPTFSSGLGLDLHIRTKRRQWWSFVQNAALRIGNDILEVASDNTHFLNGVHNAKLPSKIGGYEVSKIVVDSPFSIMYVVNLGEGQTIKISRGKRRMLSVDVSQHQNIFHGSVGLMGTLKKQGMIARDGVTDLHNDSDAFGREWQVLASENQLFHALRYPQHPEVCVEGSNKNRRLEEMPERIPLALVEKACFHVECANKDFCIYDVMATGDLSMAESPFYNKNLS